MVRIVLSAQRGIIGSMAIIHVSESEAGAEPRGRLLSASIALAETHANEMGYEPVMDAGFAADLEEIIRNRKPRNLSALK